MSSRGWLVSSSRNALAVLGISVVVIHGSRACRYFWRLLRAAIKYSNHRHTHGTEWAVVAGVSDYIGEAYANALAAKGYNLALISNALSDKLLTLSESLQDTYPSILVTKYTYESRDGIDGTFPSPDIFRDAIEPPLGHGPTILVNNIGGLGSHLYRPPAPLVETPLSAVCEVSSVNITPMLVLTRQVVEQMVRSRRKGVVIHVSGFAGRLAMPILRELSASKSFMDTWCEALQMELKQHNVTVQSAIAGPLYNPGVPSHTWFRVPASQFAEWSLARAISGEGGAYFPHPAHAIQLNLLQMFPLLTHMVRQSALRSLLSHSGKLTSHPDPRFLLPPDDQADVADPLAADQPAAGGHNGAPDSPQWSYGEIAHNDRLEGCSVEAQPSGLGVGQDDGEAYADAESESDPDHQQSQQQQPGVQTVPGAHNHPPSSPSRPAPGPYTAPGAVLRHGEGGESCSSSVESCDDQRQAGKGERWRSGAVDASNGQSGGGGDGEPD